MKFVKATGILILLLLCLLPFRDSKVIPDHPLTEDSYYSIAVAKNIANGQFFTIDGINKTNGFQPLFTAVCSLPFLLFKNDDLINPLRIILFISLLNLFLSAFLFGRIVRKIFNTNESFNISFLIFLSSPLVYINFFNGLETGFVVLMLLILWYFYSDIDINRMTDILKLGIILGFCVLTRIDMVWLVLVISIAFLFRNEINFSKRIIIFLMISGIAFIISSPWWLYNYFVFGSLMPTSGTAQQLIALDFSRIYAAFDKTLVNLVPYLYFWDRGTVGFIGIVTRIIALAFLITIITYSIKKFPAFKSQLLSDRNIRDFVLYILIFSAILILWYTITSWASHFYQRYFTPLSLLGFLITAITAVFFYNRKPKLTIILLIILALPMLIGTTFKMMDFKVKGSYFYNYELSLVQKYVPQNETVASRQSGTLGYFKKNTVNCDGKVNNDVFAYAGRLSQYLSENKIRWVCDWQMNIDSLIGTNPAKRGWVFVDSSKGFILYHQKEY